MKKMFLLIISVILLCTGCDQKKIKKTFITNYGDTFTVTVELSHNTHHNFVNYDIIGDNLDGGYLYYDRDQSKLPPNPENNIFEVLNKNEIHFYSIKDDGLFYVFNKKIDKLPRDYNLNWYLTMESFPNNEQKENFIFVIHTLMQSRRIKYLERFAAILVYENDTDTLEIIQNWSLGNFSEEEIKINTADGYTTSDLQQWASELLKDKSGY